MGGWKQFDVYLKAAEGIQERTIGGGIISFICCLLVAILFLNELAEWRNVKIMHRMHVDTMPKESPISMYIDISILHEPCSEIMLDVSDSSGDESIVIDRDVETSDLIDAQDPQNIGCRLKAKLKVQKLAGDILICHTKSSNTIFGIMDLFTFNSSHVIDKLTFGPSFPLMKTPLTNVHKTIIDNVATYKYFVSIVPSTYHYLDKSVLSTYQYSATEHQLKAESGVITTVPGVIISYDFSPIAVEYIEQKLSFFYFITNICAIVGGVMAVARILDSVLYSVSKKLD